MKQFLQKQQEPAIQQQRQFEQFISELLTSSEKKLKLKSLSLEKEAQEKSETSFLKDTSLKTETPKKDLLFDNSIHLVSVKTVAELLGLAPKTIHNWRFPSQGSLCEVWPESYVSSQELESMA